MASSSPTLFPSIPLRWKMHTEAAAPLLPIHRVVVDVNVERSTPSFAAERMNHQGVIVDTGSPYSILSHNFHHSRPVKIYEDFGMQPYRLLSMQGQFLHQRLVVIGLRFYVHHPKPAFVPDHFLRVKAYLLDASTRPTKGIILGLDALREHFVTHLEEGNAFLHVRP